VEANSMGHGSRGLRFGAETLNETVVSATGREDISFLRIEDTLKEDAATKELVVQTRQWTNVNFSRDSEAFQIGYNRVDAGEYGGQGVCVLSSFQKGTESFERFAWTICAKS
jgi:hypothetical protein